MNNTNGPLTCVIIEDDVVLWCGVCKLKYKISTDKLTSNIVKISLMAGNQVSCVYSVRSFNKY
jgi:hypothetical protein